MDVDRTHQIKIMIPLLVLLIFVFLLNLKKVYAPDVFYHLKMGEIVSNTWSPVKAEQFSFVKKGIKINHFEWLGDFILYKIYKISGFVGIETFKLIIFILLFLILFITYSQITKHYTLNSILLILIAYSIRFLSVETPVLFSLLFMSVLISILALNMSKWIYGIPLLFLFWSNIHPGFIFGIFYYLFFLTGFVFEYLIDRKKEKFQQILILFSLLLISIILTLLTPFGHNLYTRIFQQKIISDFIIKDEITILKIFSMPFTYILYLVILIVSLYNVRAIQKRYLYPFLLMSWLPFFFTNTVYLLLFAAVPPLIQLINISYENNILIIEKILQKKAIKLSLKIVPVLLAFVILFYNYYIDISGVYGFGRLKQFYPSSAIKFIKEHELYGKWFNSIEFGGAIILEGVPEILPFIYSGSDSLIDIFNAYYKKFANEPQTLSDFLLKNDIIGVIFSAGGEIDYSRHFEVLKNNSYALVYWDDNAVILVNSKMVNDEFLKSYELRQINPYKIYNYLSTALANNTPVKQKLFDEIRISSERAVDSSKVHLIYGMSLLIYNKYDEAEKELKRAFEIMPNNLFINVELALLYQKLNSTDYYNYFQKRAGRLKKIYQRSK